MEIDNVIEADPDALNDWWFAAVDGFVATVGEETQAVHPDARFVFTAPVIAVGRIDPTDDRPGAAGAGVWCENAIHYPAWGNQDTADRLSALIDLSADLRRSTVSWPWKPFY
jgi:hypothetical protein